MRIPLRRLLGRALVLAVVGLVLFTVIEEHLGNSAVKAVCERDGGLTLNAPTTKQGFLYGAGSGSDCISCIEYLASGNFTYVDYMAKGDGYGYLFPRGGYYRMTIGTVGDPACAAYDKAIGLVKSSADYFGLLPTQCIAVTPLPARPTGPVYSTLLHNEPAPWGITLSVWEHRIDDSSSGQEVAVLRDYRFYSKLAGLLDESGGGGTSSSTCWTFVKKGGRFPSVSDLFSAAFVRPSPTAGSEN